MDELLLALFCVLAVLLCQDEEEGVLAYQVPAGFAVGVTKFVRGSRPNNSTFCERSPPTAKYRLK
jgi:hypothetical protein